MFWDCKTCNTAHLLGLTHRHCPNCGSTQGTLYYPPAGQEIAVANHKYVGADWKCAYCTTPNSRSAKFCINCGAGITTPNIVKDVVPRPPAKSIKKYIFAAVALLAVGAVIAAVTIKTPETATLSEKTWARSITVEEYRQKSGDDWCGSEPMDAYNVTTTNEIKDYRQVADGQVCTTQNVDKKDGTYVKERNCTTQYRSVPVYAQMCHYRINRWTYSHRLKTAGSDAPYWAAVGVLTSNAGNTLGNQRLAGRNETYTVKLKNTADSWTCNYPEEKWSGIKLGSQWNFKVNMLGIADCSSLQQ